MNQSELIDAIAAATEFTKADTKKFLEAQAAVIHAGLKKSGDDGIALPGLGKLKVKKRSARKGRNPQTGEDIKIPARKVPSFSAAKVLKDLLLK